MEKEEEFKEKYWIQPGGCAVHKKTGAHVCVERVVTHEHDGKRFVRGVLCHWLDNGFGYQKGMFMTMELEPCK
jgi:hypothetical protein